MRHLGKFKDGKNLSATDWDLEFRRRRLGSSGQARKKTPAGIAFDMNSLD